MNIFMKKGIFLVWKTLFFRQLSLELNPVLKEQQMNLKVTFRKSLPPRSRELSGKHSLNWG